MDELFGFKFERIKGFWPKKSLLNQVQKMELWKQSEVDFTDNY